jgi:hypothetical protein
VLANVVRSIGFDKLVPVAPPAQETLPRWRRIAEGLRHSKTREAEAIHHHYDVSNTFYEWVLGPLMTYTCAVYPSPEATLESSGADVRVMRMTCVHQDRRTAELVAGGNGIPVFHDREQDAPQNPATTYGRWELRSQSNRKAWISLWSRSPSLKDVTAE